MTNQEKITEHIVAGEVEAALKLLLQQTKAVNSEWHDETLVISARHEELLRREIEGTISNDNAKLERNQVIKSILAINEKLMEETTAPPLQRNWSRYGRWIIAAALTVATALMAWLALRPVQGFYVEMEVQCSRASFRYLNGNTPLQELAMAEFKVQNFKKIDFQADTVRLEADFLGTKAGLPHLPTQALLTFAPMPDAGGSEAAFNPVQLNKLDISPGALLALGTTPEAPNELQLDIQQAERVAVELSYQSGTDFFGTYTQLEGLNGKSDWDDIGGSASAPTARKIFVEGAPGSTVFYLTSADTTGEGTQQASIGELDFSKKENEVRASSVLAAKIRFMEGEQMYKEVTVNAGEDLLPEVAEHLQLTHLNIGKDGLRLTLQGKLKSLRTGSQRTLQNPKMGQWVWQLHRMKLFGLLAVMAVAVAGLAWRKKKLQPI